jgi:hypothetical protein
MRQHAALKDNDPLVNIIQRTAGMSRSYSLWDVKRIMEALLRDLKDAGLLLQNDGGSEQIVPEQD